MTRLEAAAKAYREAPRTRGMDTLGPMRAALAAADEVTFSKEAALSAEIVYLEVYMTKRCHMKAIRAVLDTLRGGVDAP